MIFFFPPSASLARLFLTDVLPPSDDADLAVGDLTWSHRLLSAALPILNPHILSGAAQMGVRLSVRLKVLTIGQFWELQPKGWCVSVCVCLFPHHVCYL